MPRGRKLAGRRCSKGSSGEAIPCQPEPLKRRQWARVTLVQEAVALTGLARPRSDQALFTARVAVDHFRILEPCYCYAPSAVHSRCRNRPDTHKIPEGHTVVFRLDPATARTDSTSNGECRLP